MNKTVAKIMKCFGAPINVTEEEQLLDSSSAVSAKTAYMTTKYGHDKNVKDLLSDFFKHANDNIRIKTMNNEYCCMLEIDEDLKNYVSFIEHRFKDELGYNVIIIDNDTEIVHGGKPAVKVTPNSTFIILMWNTIDNEQISDNISSSLNVIDTCDCSDMEEHELNDNMNI